MPTPITPLTIWLKMPDEPRKVAAWLMRSPTYTTTFSRMPEKKSITGLRESRIFLTPSIAFSFSLTPFAISEMSGARRPSMPMIGCLDIRPIDPSMSRRGPLILSNWDGKSLMTDFIAADVWLK